MSEARSKGLDRAEIWTPGMFGAKSPSKQTGRNTMAVSMRLREAMPCCHPPTPVRLQEKLRLLASSAAEGLCRQRKKESFCCFRCHNNADVQSQAVCKVTG